MADVGKYNAGQKMMFWSIMSMIFVLLVHAILIHMYMAFWVKGSIKGMIEGKVSRRWAKKHHPRWYREIEKAEAKKESDKCFASVSLADISISSVMRDAPEAITPSPMPGKI